MTAFDDILKSEQEAEESIATAREEVANAIAVAQGERKTKIETEIQKLNQAETVALEAHRTQISNQTEQIQKKVDEEVLLIEKKFATHKADLISTLKKKFS